MTRIIIRRWTTLLVAALATLLASCGVHEPIPTVEAADDAIAHVLTIDITADADENDLASAYDAQVLSFQPEAGFAILGLKAGADRIFPQAESNADAVELAEANGISAWAGGISAWAGGISAWAGGMSAWAGGVDSDNPFPSNVDAWTDMGLHLAHAAGSPLGAGVTVAVIDTGVDVDHPALQGKLAPSWQWYDYVDWDDDPDEVAGGAAYGHGTAAAGIILQVAPEATILPLRVLDSDGRGDLSDVIYAIDDAIYYGADVINLSLGSRRSYWALRSMVEYANSRGVPVIASVGNHNGSVLYPAAYADEFALTFAVGSLDAADRKSDFSAYGPEVSVMAYGEGIASLYPENRTAHATGTSFAAPFAAGAAALVVSDLQAAGLGGDTIYLLLGNLENMLTSSSDASIYQVNDSTYSGKLGAGRLNVGGFLSVVRNLLPSLGGIGWAVGF